MGPGNATHRGQAQTSIPQPGQDCPGLPGTEQVQGAEVQWGAEAGGGSLQVSLALQGRSDRCSSLGGRICVLGRQAQSEREEGRPPSCWEGGGVSVARGRGACPAVGGCLDLDPSEEGLGGYARLQGTLAWAGRPSPPPCAGQPLSHTLAGALRDQGLSLILGFLIGKLPGDL